MSPKPSALSGLTEDQILELAQNADAIKAKAEQVAAQRAAAAAAAELGSRGRAKREAVMMATALEPRRHRRTGVPWYDALTQEEQLKAIAEANLAAYGTIVPPPEERLMSLSKTCPSCHKTKAVMAEFGFRIYKGTPIAQSRCRSCRREADLHQRNP